MLVFPSRSNLLLGTALRGNLRFPKLIIHRVLVCDKPQSSPSSRRLERRSFLLINPGPDFLVPISWLEWYCAGISGSHKSFILRVLCASALIGNFLTQSSPSSQRRDRHYFLLTNPCPDFLVPSPGWNEHMPESPVPQINHSPRLGLLLTTELTEFTEEGSIPLFYLLIPARCKIIFGQDVQIYLPPWKFH